MYASYVMEPPTLHRMDLVYLSLDPLTVVRTPDTPDLILSGTGPPDNTCPPGADEIVHSQSPEKHISVFSLPSPPPGVLRYPVEEGP